MLFLTASVDVQKDYLICEIVGWGEDKQSWSIDVRIFQSDPNQDEVWKHLDGLLSEQWHLSNGLPLSLRILALDSGYLTQVCYSWARKHSPSKVMLVKGQDHLTTIVGMPKAQDVNRNGKIYYNSVKVWPIGVSSIKHELYSWLNLEKPIKPEDPYPNGYLHFPEYSEDYFKMLLSEQCVQKMTRSGGIRWEWQKLQLRNESLDLKTMNRAAACVVGLDRWNQNHWDQLKTELRLDNVSMVNKSRKRKFTI